MDSHLPAAFPPQLQGRQHDIRHVDNKHEADRAGTPLCAVAVILFCAFNARIDNETGIDLPPDPVQDLW